MNPLTKHKKTVILPFVVLLVLIVFAGLIVMYRVARPVKGDQSVQTVEVARPVKRDQSVQALEVGRPAKGDQSVQVIEKRQRSVTEDPAVKGEFAKGWLVPHAGAGLPQPTPTEIETLEWVKVFKNTQAPRIIEENLSPGARRTVRLQIAGPSGLTGSARWVGAIRPLHVIIALNGSTLATGTAYHVGSNRGGSYLQTRTTTGGLATMSVTNTSGVNAKVRIVFAATAL